METLGNDNNNISNSILILRNNTRKVISNLLNSHKFLKTEKGLPRDWQGLAELCEIAGELIPNISSDHDQTGKVLKIWEERCKHEATINKLINFLKELDREDVVDDILPLIEEDIESYKKHGQTGSFDFEIENTIITRDDQDRISKGLGPQKYDAFVLFEDDDISFATDLIEKMEKDYDLKFCVKDRDLISGQPEHDAIIKLITERCGRLIVILSPAFLQSNVSNFFYSLTQSVAITQSRRKIIPVIYKECGPLRPELSYYFKLDYRRAGSLWNFWDKLHESIVVPEVKGSTKLPVSDVGSLSANQLLSSTDKPMIKEVSSTQLDVTNSLKNSVSMSNLPTIEVPQDNLAPSTSANSLGKYEDYEVKKSPSFYKKFKLPKIQFPTLKSNKHSHSKQNVLKDDEISTSTCSENQENFNSIKGLLNSEVKAPKDIKEVKKEKKLKFTLKRNKKKVAIAET